MPKSRRNYGVSLLKAIMCFEVLCCHFMGGSQLPIWQLPFSMLQTSAVPVFLMLSFLLCRDDVVSGDPDCLKKRLRRLLWPQISWAIVYYLVCVLLNGIDGGEPLGLDALVGQLLTGSNERLNPAMWFQVDLILLTVLFSLLFAWLKPGISYGVLVLVSVCAMAFAYSGRNFALFEPLRAEIKYSIGRLAEVWPFAAAAICLFHPGLLKAIKTHWLAGCFGGTILCGISLLIKKPCAIYDSFGYAGIHMLLGAAGMVILFYSLPLEKLGGKIPGFIDRLSRYSLGIYCMHLLIAKILYSILTRMNIRTGGFWYCVVLYALSYLVCWAMDRTGKKYLSAMVR